MTVKRQNWKTVASTGNSFLVEGYKLLMKIAVEGYVKHGRGCIYLSKRDGKDERTYLTKETLSLTLDELKKVIARGEGDEDAVSRLELLHSCLNEVNRYNPDLQAVLLAAADEHTNAHVLVINW